MNLPASDLRVTLVQAATHWHDAKANRVMYGDLLRPLAGSTDLVVLPEAFTSGFTNENLTNAETMDGVTVRWMGALHAHRERFPAWRDADAFTLQP